MLYLERAGIYDRNNDVQTLDESVANNINNVEHNSILNLIQKGINIILGNTHGKAVATSNNRNSVQAEAKRLLLKGKLTDAIDCILYFAEKTGDTVTRNEALMLSGRLHYLSREQLKGSISTQDLMVERNQIKNQLLCLLAG